MESDRTPIGNAALEDARSKCEIIKCLPSTCFATKYIFAHVVPCKSAGEYYFAAHHAIEDIPSLGHTQLILKGDIGTSPQALINRLLELYLAVQI